MEIKIPLGNLGGNKQLSQAIGKCGEWVTELILNSGAVTGHYKTLHNLYIPYRGNTAEYIITQRDILPFKLRYDLNSRNDIFTEKQVEEIAKRLQTLTRVSEQVKQDHVDNIKSKYY